MKLLQAKALAFAYPTHQVFSDLNVVITPGLTLVRGGDGRGKTTLLRVLAGQWAPSGGQLWRQALESWFDDPRDPAHRDTVARAWLQGQRARHPGWDEAQAQHLIDAFDLAPHLDKPMYMLSTGSGRKLGWVAACASGAPVTVLDTPFAALDAVSVRALTQRLRQAAQDTQRAWLLGDHECPEGLAEVPWAGQIDLGD